MNGEQKGAWVSTSLKYWQSHLKGKIDYHGNFNAELFEMWFQELCNTLFDLYGPCIIHMDGARYHKRVLRPASTAQWRKPDIQVWLKSRNFCIELSDLKADLLLLLKATKVQVRYATVGIAREYGYEVHYTPPYHPELEPIEAVWACAKNRIAADPAKNEEHGGT
ncbi:hypothetical protein ACHHYP_13910 [Achlya hypogyna]|uniref:Tc1-like transposase DDE domain-containing protein n=1 Tax=Achlya hypogyna TaxID=1202772 RepID=A0A1V9YEJ3_ACHHY|nr:hypothetical protein ACHHYP_13910 [Achlya hypogyna]